MKNLKYFLLTIGLIISGFFQLSGQGCDPQITGVNIIDRPSYCITNGGDDVELEIAWTMGQNSPGCNAPAGSWQIVISMPQTKEYKINNPATDILPLAPFTWTYDVANNTIRGLNNAIIAGTSSGIVKINISGTNTANLNTACVDISSGVNIQIVPAGSPFFGSPASFTNEIGNDVSSFYLETRLPMTVTQGTIANCYDTQALAEAAAIAATTATTTCSGTISKTASTSGVCAAVISVTVTNECGDVQTKVYNTRIDNVDPVFDVIPVLCGTTPSRPANTGFCTYTVVGTEFDAIASDNCGGITYGYVLTGMTMGSGTSLAGVALNAGVTTVTWTATDFCGKFSTCQFTVTVNDTQPPIFTFCPPDITVGKPGYPDPYATGMAIASDNCLGVTVTYSDDRAGLTGCNATGTIVRTFTAKDASNNAISTCIQNITIQDTRPPVITCPPSVTINTDPNLCSAVHVFTPVAIDSAYRQGFEHPGYMSGPIGNPSTDWNNYSSSLTRVLSGTGGIASKSGAAHGLINSAVLPPPPDDFTGIFSRQGGYSPTFGLGFKTSIDIYIDPDNPAVGANTYGFDISSAVSNQVGGHRRDFIFHVSAIGGSLWINGTNNSNGTRRNDLNQPPNPMTNGFSGPSYQLDPLINDAAWYTFEWVFRNNGGILAVDYVLKNNAGSIIWSITRSDPSDLIPSVVGGNRYMWFTFIEPSTSDLAIDNSYMERNVPVVCSLPSGTAFPVGTTTVMCSATDACGNVSNCSFTVKVEDHENPIAICQDVTVQLDNTGNGSTTAVAVNNGSSDACGIASIVLSQTVFNCSEVGTITETLTVTDVNGNESMCTTVVTVVDGILPVALCQNVTVQLDATGNGSTTAALVNNGSSDACGIASMVLSQTAFNCSEVGANTETLTVTDVNGNVSMCNTTVTVVDDVDPIAICQNVTVQLDATGNGSTTAALVNNGSSDACGIASMVLSQIAFVCSEVGPNMEVLTVTDVNGNESMCNTVVTVVDGIIPTVSSIPVSGAAIVGYTCGNPTPLMFNTDPNSCVSSKSIIKPIWADNCGIMSSTASAINGVNPVTISDFGAFVSGAFPKGITTVTFTATDNSGNTNTCTLLIEVKDMTLPSIVNCPTNISVMAPVNACTAVVTWSPPPTAFDNCSGVTLVQTSSPTTGLGIGSAFPIGVTTILYTATDASGNTATCSFTVTVSGTCSNQTELTITFLIEASNFLPEQNRDAIYTVNNISANPTNTPVQVFIQYPADLIFNSSVYSISTNINMFGFMFMSNNSEWIFTPVMGGVLCTLNGSIAAGGTKIIALNIEAVMGAIKNATAFTTGTIGTGSGGDQIVGNNYAQSTFTVN